jgi:hypothetical protein
MTLSPRARRALALLVSIAAWIVALNIVAAASHVDPWLAFATLAALAPFTARVTAPLF